MEQQTADALAQQAEMQAQMEAMQGMGAGIAIFYLLVLGFFGACAWKLFTKAGQPGWAAIVPIYNIIIMLKIVGRPTWWIVLFVIPFVSLIPAVLLPLDLAKSFGKSTGFGVGLILLGFIFMPILAFGSAKYVGPSAGGGSAPAPVAA